ncbi:MAG: B12-binding domain-containing radical SAM protein [Candidatus Hadarchaeum sp.]|uniref:B12-binding domain-containing radical SAM protein n=1 Tax=Candidatus Hadarchaeum sp. TaxID=2883567 RepID=UPI003D10E0B3
MSEIVLTAEYSLMSDYRGSEFLGFAACAPKLVPEWLYRWAVCPPLPQQNGIVKYAPGGTRKIEAALLEKGFDVVVAHPEHLDKVIDDKTKVVGITSNDPLGIGPASSTFSGLMGQETYSAIFFRKLVTGPIIKENGLKTIVGGPGAWQLADEAVRRELGIDCVVIGEGERTAVKMFEKALKGESLPGVVEGEVVPLEEIPSIKNATVNGIVEIARGCGRGCEFCVPTMRYYRCRPVDKILEEVKVNLDAGLDRILLHAEDVLRYGAKGIVPDETKVLNLFKEVKKTTGWGAYISHFAFASVMAKPELVKSLSELMEVPCKKIPWIAGQVGIETGSPRLLERHMRGKVAPFKPEQWPEVVVEAHKILHDNHWVPCSTLIMGLPGETTDDVTKTIELVEELKDYKSLIVPLFFVPLGVLGKEKRFTVEDMKPEHWKLLAACVKHDLNWIDELATEEFRSLVSRFLLGKVLIGVIKRGVKPYLKKMEQGLNPILKREPSCGK